MPLIKEDKLDSVPIYTYRSKSVTERKTLIWEIENMESIMSEGILNILGLEFEMGSVSEISGKSVGYSKWRLQLDTSDDEPAISLHLLQSSAKVLYYKLSAQVLRKPGTEGFDVCAYPQEDYFYEATSWDRKEEARKFTFHRQLEFGCSYCQWMPKCLIEGGTLPIKINVQICQAVVQNDYPSDKEL